MNACANCKINKTCPNANESDGFEVCEDSEDRQIDGGIKMTNREKVAIILDELVNGKTGRTPHTSYYNKADQILSLFPTFTEEWLEKIIDEVMPCSCIPAYKDRNLTAPDCANCNYKEDLVAALLSQGKAK